MSIGRLLFLGGFGRRERALLVVAATLMALSFLGPLWSIRLDAPQYPEGLAMHVYTWRLGGRVDIINSLNHYIGMKAVKETDFVEFRVLPWVFGGAVATMLGAAWTRRRWVAGALLVNLSPLLALLLYDLYRWLWAYGNELDPAAPISMSPFTPPMIGGNRVANFYTLSYFNWGTLLLATALVLVVVALWKSRPSPNRERSR